MAGLWQENAPQYGYEVVVHEEYAPGATDFSDMILKAQAAEADAVFALPTPPDGIAIFKQMGELDYTPKFSFFVRAPDTPAWGKELGPVGDYMTLGPGWHNAMKFPGVEELNQAYQAQFDRPADPMVGPAYAAVQILADAIERAGTAGSGPNSGGCCRDRPEDDGRPDHFQRGWHWQGFQPYPAISER